MDIMRRINHRFNDLSRKEKISLFKKYNEKDKHNRFLFINEKWGKYTRKMHIHDKKKNKEIMSLEIDEEYLEKYCYSELLENSLIITFASVKYLLNQKEEE